MPRLTIFSCGRVVLCTARKRPVRTAAPSSGCAHVDELTLKPCRVSTTPPVRPAGHLGDGRGSWRADARAVHNGAKSGALMTKHYRYRSTGAGGSAASAAACNATLLPRRAQGSGVRLQWQSIPRVGWCPTWPTWVGTPPAPHRTHARGQLTTARLRRMPSADSASAGRCHTRQPRATRLRRQLSSAGRPVTAAPCAAVTSCAPLALRRR